MAYKDMTQVDTDQLNANAGAVYYEKVELSSGSESDEYILPPTEVYAIACYIDGDGELQFTQDPRSVIEAGSADYEAWDGASLINNSVTGFKVTRNSGTVTTKVTVRTSEAS